MLKMNKKIVVTLLAVIVFLVSCKEQSDPAPSISLTPCKLGASSALCGTLRVYENRIANKGRKIDIHVAVIKAASPNPAPDPIFYLAGGPGGSAIEDGKRPQFSSSISFNHDLVFVDQRGTGNSNPQTVSQGFPDFAGLTPEQIDANVRARAWEYVVLKFFKMDSRFYTTSLAMDDLDDVREALGYDKINLVGYSYGATAAQYYLRQHEEHVRTVTLGSGSLLDKPVFELWAQNGQKALDSIFDLCLADPSCKAAYPNLRGEFTEVLSRLEANPVTISLTDPSTEQPVSVTLSSDIFAASLRNMTSDAKNDPNLPKLIHQVYQENDWKGFSQLYADGWTPQWWGNLVMEHTIRCYEKWASFNPAAVAESSKGSYLAEWDISLAKHQAFSCQFTPEGVMPEGDSQQPGSNVPVLTLNGELDPIDPPGNMAGAKQLWPNSLSLVGPYQGHSISNMNEIICWFSILDKFINSGSADGLDTSCMQDIQVPTFNTQK